MEKNGLLSSSNLEKLEWSLLTTKLASHAQTDEARQVCATLTPSLGRHEVESRWSEVTSLRDLARSGYKAPIGELTSPLRIFKAAEKGQILEGMDLRKINDILQSTKRVLTFAGSFAVKSSTLKNARDSMRAVPELSLMIDKTVTTEGQLKDDASPELAAIRQLKTNLRKRIEEHLDQLLCHPEISDYLQDAFYTVRHEKYVIPIRLDGRGRIKGKIVDTSDSGQTLFLEPTTVSQMNQDLHDLDVAERLEIIRIFRDLSAAVARELDIIRFNYESLVDLDIKTAEACFAVEIDAGKVDLSETPCLHLIEARHPLIKSTNSKTAVPNTIILERDLSKNQQVLIVTGPNAGGKTVVLKTVGLIHLMAKAGLLIPVEPSSKIFLFEELFLEMGDNQNITTNLSTFSGHLMGLKPILESASAKDLVLLDELATGTEPQTGSAIAQAVIEHLISLGTTAIVTTHFDGLKTIALKDSRYRNASMEYAVSSYSPTYRLVLDVPGQSYGLELANKMGIPESIISRARELRGSTETNLDSAINALQSARQQSEELRSRLEHEIILAEAAKARWTEECKLLDQQRAKAARSTAAKIETEVEHLRAEFEDTSKELKQVVKEIRSGNIEPDVAYEKKRMTASILKDMEMKVASIAQAGQQQDLPGTAISTDDIKTGLNVYVLPLRREGIITKVGLSANDPIEVQVGIIKVRVSVLDLRKTRGLDANQDRRSENQSIKTPKKQNLDINQIPEFVPQTAANTIDLRGSDVDQALEKTLNFLDKCLRCDERFVVLIHGHGNDRLKNSVRSMLKNNCPYAVSSRPGSASEGGDGVTIVSIG